MILALYIIGIAALIISLVTGFLSGSFIGFLIFAASGISSVIILFALARILENQENILYKLQYQEELKRTSLGQKSKRCSKCNYEYDSEYNSCPHCGYKV